jgi:simple sugar transport system permease protein
MQPLIDALYGIPILGIFAQLVGYIVAVLPAIAPIVWGLATPIALGSLCGVMNERSGIVNIGIEGMMLTAAFVGFVVGAAAVAFIPAEPGFLGITPALVLALIGAVAAAMLLSALHAWLSITVRADQIISGTIINIIAIGLTGYLNRLVSQTSPQAAGSFRPFSPPAWLVDIPLIGWLLKMVLAQGPIAMSVIVLAVGLQIWLFYSRWGLRTRAVGEHPKAAETVGIDVIRLRYRNVIVGGIFAGLAGAYLSLEATGSFQAGMTNGRGFIALAALIFGRWTPLGALGAALLFTASEALGTAIRFQSPPGQLGDILTAIPSQFFSALPYVVTVVVLAGVVGRSIPPAAVGRPYEKESPA